MVIRLFYLLLFVASVCGEKCPKQCDCVLEKGLNRADCIGQNLVSVDIAVPKQVQVYILSRNSISELDNYCFKNAGYSSIQVLDLSYNLIFWIGLHALSGLDGLVHINLSNNRLREIPSDLFWENPNLATLDLSLNVFEELKNEPFIMHDKLQILNLNNCRIKSVPERLFNRLPNLRKLDLSENYMVTLKVDVISPLRRLERIELKSEYLQCTRDFAEVEKWIKLKGLTYENICKKRTPKMFEKIISIITERPEVDINDVWNVTRNVTLPVVAPTIKMTPYEKFNREFSALQALIIGLEIGLAVGVVGTYVWLRRVCCCKPIVMRTRRRGRRPDGDMGASLLRNYINNPDMATPPMSRHAQPDGRPRSAEIGLRSDAIRALDRPETPPPPYYPSVG